MDLWLNGSEIRYQSGQCMEVVCQSLLNNIILTRVFFKLDRLLRKDLKQKNYSRYKNSCRDFLSDSQ